MSHEVIKATPINQPEGPAASRGPVSAGDWFCPLFLVGRGLPPKCVCLAVGASFLGPLQGLPNLFTLAALRGEFLRESLHPPPPSVRLMACPFLEGEGNAQ